MKIKLSPALTLPLIIVHISLTLVMLLWLVHADVKVVVQNPCVYYVNVIEFTGRREECYSIGYATEQQMIARQTYETEVARNVTVCDYNCPDSIQIILYSMCDSSQNYESTVVAQTTIN